MSIRAGQHFSTILRIIACSAVILPILIANIHIAGVTAAGGLTYYVDGTTGSDSDTGLTEGLAFATIQKAADVAAAGDTVLIKDGTYRETVTAQASGAADSPITFKNYPGASPVVSGTDVMTGWASLGAEESGGVFNTGLESGGTADFSSLTISGTNTLGAVTAEHANGLYSMQMTSDGVNKNVRANKDFTSNADVYARIYFKLDANFDIVATNQRVDILNLLETSATSRGRVAIQKDGSGNYSLVARTETPSVTTIYSGTPGEITKGTWHYVEYRYKGNSATGGGEVWLDGVSKGSNYSLNTTGLNINRIEVGGRSSAQSLPTSGSKLYFDNVKVATSPVGAFTPVGDDEVYKKTGITWTARQVYDNDEPLNEEVSVAALDENEFFMDTATDTLYVHLDGSLNPSTRSMEVARRQYVISAFNKSHLTFDGLNVVRNNTISSGGFHLSNTDNSIIKNSTSAENLGKGIYLVDGSSNNLLQDNILEDNLGEFGGGVRIEMGSNDNILEHNEISGYHNISKGSSGIQIRSSDGNIIRHNSIHDAWDSGVYLTENSSSDPGSSNNEVYNNLIYNINESMSPGNAGNGIHVAIDSNDNLIYNNLIHDVYGYGVQLRHNAGANKVLNNTIARTGLGGHGDGIGLIIGSTLGATGPYDNSIYNNIVHTAEDACFSADTDSVAAGGNVLDYNLCYNPGNNVGEWNGTSYGTLAGYQAGSGQAAHSHYGDPLFADFNNSNFSITSASPAFDTGLTRSEVMADYIGTSRPQHNNLYDIGAYEVIMADDPQTPTEDLPPTTPPTSSSQRRSVATALLSDELPMADSDAPINTPTIDKPTTASVDTDQQTVISNNVGKNNAAITTVIIVAVASTIGIAAVVIKRRH